MEQPAEFTSTDPAEIQAQTPKYPSREQTIKLVQEKYPGHIAWASDRANFAGCRAIRFGEYGKVEGLEKEDLKLFEQQCKEAGSAGEASAEDLMNLYFSTRANLLVVQYTVDMYDICLLVTTQLDEEDLEEMNEVNTRVQLGMREWREERAQRMAVEREKEAEDRRYAMLGRQWEQHNLPGRIKELEEANAALRKLVPNAV